MVRKIRGRVCRGWGRFGAAVEGSIRMGGGSGGSSSRCDCGGGGDVVFAVVDGIVHAVTGPVADSRGGGAASGSDRGSFDAAEAGF